MAGMNSESESLRHEFEDNSLRFLIEIHLHSFLAFYVQFFHGVIGDGHESVSPSFLYPYEGHFH